MLSFKINKGKQVSWKVAKKKQNPSFSKTDDALLVEIQTDAEMWCSI